MNDKIIINGLEVFGNHGVLKEEKILGQKFIINIVAFIDLNNAYRTDNLDATVNYAEICKFVENYMKCNTFDLIESVAGRLSEEILIMYPLIEKIEVEVQKPWAPVEVNLNYVGVSVSKSWNDIYLSLGSNLGDRNEYIDSAINMIENNPRCKELIISDKIETKPVGNVEQGDFINCAVKLKTLLNPYEFLEFIVEIESELKRERLIKWGPRTIDVDIILYEDYVINSEKLTIPHNQMHLREFVLKPLVQIAADVKHPIYEKNVYTLYKELLTKE